MRKFKRFPPRGLRFSSLLILTGAVILWAPLTPRANADLIAYYNFEGTATPGFPVNINSHPPAIAFPSGNPLIITYNPAALIAAPGIPLNVAPGDPAPNLTGLGLTASGANSPSFIDIRLFSSQGFFSNMSLSFAINAEGNGFTQGQIFFSTNGGGTFTAVTGIIPIPTAGVTLFSVAIPTAANNQNLLVLRIALSGGQSNGANLQNDIDNIQVNGTIVPEPATVAGGLLGVLGLCWHQRRRFKLLLPRLRCA